MDFSAVLSFTLIAVTLIVVPGPDWAYVLASGVRDRVVVPAVAGLMMGYACLTTVVAVGIGPIVAGSATALLVLTACGAVYLVYLGIKVLHSPAHLGHAESNATKGRSRGQYVLRGAGVSALNPKGLLLFLAVLPQFTRRAAAWPLPIQLAVLGAIFTAACGGFYLLLGYVSDRALSARPGAARIITKVAGVAMIVVGLLLLAERLGAITW